MQTRLHLVVGLGKTGHSIARYLQRRNRPFIVFDTRTTPPGLDEFHAEFPGVDLFCQELPESIYLQIIEVIASPGISLEEPVLQKAIQRNIPILGDIECLAREINVPIVAITGTNGKSTVTTLVGEMAKAAGRTVAVAGNIGLPVLDILDVGVQYDLWVLELSSFQLDLTYSLKSEIATILNVTPDHLDRHHTMEAYIQSKQRVYHHAKMALYNREDSTTYPQESTSSQISFGLDTPTPGQWGILEQQGKHYIAFGQDAWLSVDELRIKGRHNWANAMAACALAQAIEVNKEQMIEVLKRFTGLPHRCQWVRTLDSVDYINDSKGTNVGATVSAIAGIGGAITGKIILIAGGQGKGADFSDLRPSMSAYVRGVVLIGADADKIEQGIDGVVPIIRASTLVAAVRQAKLQAHPGDVVLLSPACASFDMFRDFNHRGDEFALAVNAL